MLQVYCHALVLRCDSVPWLLLCLMDVDKMELSVSA